jgi:predicted  nucleic acid-binding Zn-ribbon protein
MAAKKKTIPKLTRLEHTLLNLLARLGKLEDSTDGVWTEVSHIRADLAAFERSMDGRFKILHPVVRATHRLVFEKETLQKQNATLELKLREANAYMSDDRVRSRRYIGEHFL